MEQELRDRLTRIETEFRINREHRDREMESIRDSLKQLAEQQTKITNRILKLDGGFWLALTFAGVIGFFVSNFKHLLVGRG